LVECDGARNKPLKAHTDYDPMVPKFATNVIIIVGAEVISTKIGDGLVHRPELFSNHWKISPDTSLDIGLIVKVVSSQMGYLTKISHDVNITYFVNKADENPNSAMDLAKAIFEYTSRPTFYGSVQKNRLEKVVSS
jgi:probable selenium-dependent hydroxylase accessory protein YqeC